MKRCLRFLEDNNICEKILYILVAAPGLFLLVNEYPLFAIISNGIVFLIGIFFLFARRSITGEHYGIAGVLAVIYGYLIFNYFISGQSVYNFFSYQFLRYDGSFFFSYMMFFALAVPFFDYRKVAGIYLKFVFFIFSLFALIAVVLYSLEFFPIFFKHQGTGDTFTAFNFAHNAAGSVYAAVSIFLVVFVLIEKIRFMKAIYSVLLLLCAVGLFLTRSRGSYVGFAVGVVAVLWIYFRSVKKFLIALAIAIGASAPLVYFSGAYKRVMQIFDFGEANISWRFILWERALYMFKQSPIFGVGLGRFNDIDFPSRLNDFSFQNLNVFTGYPGIVSFFTENKYDFSNAHAHNSYLQYMAETGVIGIGLIIFFWVLVFRKLFIAYNSIADPFSRKVFLGSMGCIAALFALSLSENYFSAATIMMFISMISSLGIGIYWQEKISVS
jgi:O-antigen ligase